MADLGVLEIVEIDGELHSAAIRDTNSATSNLRFRTAAEIAAEAPTNVPWIASPWVARGAITEVMGKPKAAGKTTWLMRMVASVVEGATFLDHATRKTPVVYLTEERDSTLRESLRRASLLERADLYVLNWQDTIKVSWPEIMDAAVGKCKEVGAELLVVDTLSQFARLAGDSENNAGSVLAAYRPLQEAAGSGLGVIAVRHERKGGGDVADAGRGSSAFTGAADIVLAIRQPVGKSRASIREIQALSRFDETPDFLNIELTDSGYVSLGDSAAIAQREAMEAISAVAPDSEGAALALDQLLDLAHIKRTTGQLAIAELEELGRLQRIGRGVKRDPYRWHSSVRPAETTTPNTAEQNSDDELWQLLEAE